MLELKVTGNLRDIANSAWVSTLDEIKTQQKSDQEVERVVNFLIENHHTSPFECVTLTFHDSAARTNESNRSNIDMETYIFECKFAKFDEIINDKFKDHDYILTIDLLNFIKVTQEHSCWDYSLWILFEKQEPELAKILKGFQPIKPSKSEDILEEFKDSGMSVELVNLHKSISPKHSRATWRIKCPLSIALQFVRHRSSSINMASGRYRTLKQELIDIPQDCLEYLEQTDLKEIFQESFGKANEMIKVYLSEMKNLKQSKDDELISNEEYKRLREVIRFILPEGRLTEFYATFYLSDFYSNYLVLRDSVHAQKEHIWIAQKMKEVLDEAEASSDQD